MPTPRSILAVVACLLAVAASCSGDDEKEVSLTASLDAHPISTVSAVLSVETDPPTPVSFTIEGDDGVSIEAPASEAAAEHRLPVVGMRAESDYTITVTAGEEEQVLEWTTGALPDDLPPLRLDLATEASAPGFTVFNAMSFVAPPEGELPDAGFVLAVDDSGAVVWFHRLVPQVLDVSRTERGTFLLTAGESVIQEVNLLGETVKEWGSRVATEAPGQDLQGRPLASDATVPVDIDSAHHEVHELPNGNTITLSTELIELTEEQAAELCPDNPKTSIVSDTVAELSPDGELVQEWKLSDVFDPMERPGTEMCIDGPLLAPPNWFYGVEGGTRDWTHANAVEVDEENNALLVSLRHLDSIVALRYRDDDDGAAGELLWELGPEGTLELEEGGTYPSHQHAMELQEDGSLLMYDNGNLRQPPVSRAVQYEIDVEAGTARQVWEHADTYADGRPVFTPFLGDVDRLPNGNVLITHGGGSLASGVMIGRIVEVDPATDELVFDLQVGDGTQPQGWTVYRSTRYESLYE